VICLKAHKRKGYILVTILAILGFVYFLYDRIVNATLLHTLYSKTYLAKKQANLLVFAGFSMALLKLISFEDGSLVEQEAEEQLAGISTKTVVTTSVITHKDRLKSFYFGLLPILNTWQKIVLTDEQDGINAEIFFCLTAEDGKLPLNEIFDTEAKLLKPGYKELFADFKLKNVKTGEGDLEKILEQSLAQGQHTFDDVTQISIKERLNFFYQPKNFASAASGALPDKSSEINDKKHSSETKKSKASEHNIATQSKKTGTIKLEVNLADLFRWLNISDNKINPLLLTGSTEALLGISEENVDRQGKRFLGIVRKMVDTIDFSWTPDKQLISSLFGKQSQDSEKGGDTSLQQTHVEGLDEAQKNDKLPILEKFFTKNMEPEFFSLLCLVRYNEISEQAIIIFRRQTIKEKYAPECRRDDSASTQGLNDAKKEGSGSQENAQDEKKRASLYKRCFFLPDGFEIIRLYWL
jgi:hypothetical protein